MKRFSNAFFTRTLKRCSARRPPYESSGRQYLRRCSKPAALLGVDRLRAPIRGVPAGAEILPYGAQDAAARDTRAAGASIPGTGGARVASAVLPEALEQSRSCGG